MRIRHFNSLSELPPPYDDLFQKQTQETLYLTRYWFQNLIDTSLERNSQLHIFAVEESDDRPALLAILRSPAGQNGSTFADWWLGQSTLAGLTTFQSSYFSVIQARHLDDKSAILAYDALAKGIAQSAQRWDLIDLNLLDPEQPSYDCLASAFERVGYYIGRYVYKGNWYEDLQSEDFDDYVSQRAKSAGKQIKNYQRKARKLLNTNRMKVRIYCEDDDLDEIIAVYKQIYSTSWKDTDEFPLFLEGLLRCCFENGSIRFAVVTIDRKPAALEFAIVTGIEAVMMRTAYDPTFKKESPGALAMLSMIEHLLDVDNVKRIDFGTDDDPYKATWVKSRRLRCGLAFFNKKTLQGNLLWSNYIRRRLYFQLRSAGRRAFKRTSSLLSG